MANEYNELEQLVNDVTNIDTARMTLRWSLERLNAIEKERAELKKTLAVTEDTRKTLEAKVQTLEQSFKSRGKALEEKEGFYAKLEATMALLGDGKLDIQQLLKKEARLDQARLELEREYQDKFEELDRNQNSVIERWNQRLLEVESQYAKRLSESQTRYDSLRQELEADYQGRLGALETSYLRKEKELTARIRTLEASVNAGGDALESRRKEVEAEFLARKNEIESNYLKLKSLLEHGFQERIRSMENEQSAQVRSLEKTWNAERERLLAEQHARDEQAAKSQQELARMEAQLSSQQEAHHRELIALISEKEDAFRLKAAELEKEKAAYEKAAAELASKLELKEKDWEAQKGELQADFARRTAEIEAAAMERALAFENDGAARREAMEKLIAASKEEAAREAAVRVADARRDLEAEKARLIEDNQLKGLALSRAAEMIRDLEVTLASSGEEHQRELLAKIRTNEENFRAKLAEFETEKAGYQAEIRRLIETAGEKDSLSLEETRKLQQEFSEKFARLEAETAAAAAKDKAAYEERLAALTASFQEKEKNWVLERERLSNELAALSNDAQALASERVEKIKISYEARKAELEKQFEEKLAAETSALAFEKAQMIADLKTASEQYTRLTAQFKDLENTLAADRRAHHAEVMSGLAEKEAALNEQAEKFGRELALKDELAAKAAAESSAKETGWLEEKKILSAEFEARLKLQEEGLAKRESALENQYRLKAAELEKNAAEVRELMEADFRRRVEVEKQAFEDAKARLSDENRLKGEQLAEARALAAERVEKIRAIYETRKADLEKQLEERLTAASTALAFEKARLLADLKTASEEYTKLAERSKELENTLAADRREHHEALMRQLAEKEAALQAQSDNFNKENLKLREEIEQRAAAWQAERERLAAGADEARAAAARETAARTERIAKEYDEKRMELERILNERLAEQEAVFRLEAEKTREAGRLKDERLEASHERIKELESRLNALAGAHHEELSSRLAEKEAALKEQAAALNAEKEMALAERAAELKARSEAFAAETAELRREMDAREAAWRSEREKLLASADEARVNAGREVSERSALIAKEFDRKKAELERLLGERLAAKEAAFRLESAKILEEGKLKDDRLAAAHARAKELESRLNSLTESHLGELAARTAEKEAALKEQAAALNAEKETALAERAAELKARSEAFAAETAELRREMDAREAAWRSEREKLLASADEARVNAGREVSERSALIAKEFDRKKAELERLLGERLAAKEAAFQLEAAKILEEGKLKDDRLAASYARAKELESRLNSLAESHLGELAARGAEKEAALKEQAAALNAEKETALAQRAEELKARSEAFAAETAKLREDMAAREAAWRSEREKLLASADEARVNAGREVSERAALIAKEFDRKKTELERILGERLAAKEAAFRLEAAKILEEGKLKDDRLAAAHARAKELEGRLNSLSENHLGELAARTAEKEAALKAQAEKFAVEAREMQAGFKAKETAWSREKAELGGEYAARLLEAERNVSARENALREQYRLKEADAAKNAAEVRRQAEAELARRVAEEKARFEAGKTQLDEQLAIKDKQLDASFAKIKELEERLGSLKDANHSELMAAQEEKEAALRSQSANFNSELGALREAHNAKTAFMTREKDAALKAQAESFNKELASLREAAAMQDANWSREKERLNAAMQEAAQRAERELKARAAQLSAEYDDKKAELGRILNERLAEKDAVMKLESEKILEASRLKDEQLASEHARVKELERRLNSLNGAHHQELLERMAEKEAALKTQAETLNKEKAEALKAAEQAMAERENALNAEYEKRKAELDRRYEEKYASASEALSFEKARLISDLRTASEEYTRLAAHVKELEGTIASDRQAHRGELMERLSEKEAALKTQAEGFNKELTSLREAAAMQEAEWSREKERLNAAMQEAAQRAERELKARAAQLSAEYDDKKAELGRILNERLAEKDAVMKLESEKILEASRLKDEQLASEHARVKELERRLNSLNGAHHQELLERMAEKEAALKTQAETLNKEKAEALKAAEQAMAERENALNAEYEKRKAELDRRYEEKYASASEALSFEKARLISDLRTASEEYTRLAAHVKELEGTIASDRQAHRGELMARLAEKEAALKAQAEEFNAEIARLREHEALEKEREAGENKAKDERLSAAYAKIAELQKRAAVIQEDLQAELSARLQEKEAAFTARLAALETEGSTQREALEAGFSARVDALNRETAARSEAERKAWQSRQAALETMLARSTEAFEKAQKEIESLSAAVSRRDDENGALKARLAEQEARSAEAVREAGSRALAEKAAQLEAAFGERKERLEAGISRIKEELRSESAKRSAELEANYDAAVARLAAENGSLRDAAAGLRAEIAEARKNADSYLSELMSKEHKHQAELLDLKGSLAAEFEARIAAAAEKAAAAQQDRMRFLEKEMERLQQENADALRAAEAAFGKEKEFFEAELARRQDHAAVMEQKLLEMEAEIAKSRQNIATAQLSQLTEQEEKFSALAAEYEASRDRLEAEAAARVEDVRKQGEERLKLLEARLKETERAAREEREAELKDRREQELRAAELNAGLARLEKELRAREEALAAEKARLSAREQEVAELKKAASAELAVRLAEAAEKAAAPLKSRIEHLERSLEEEKKRGEEEMAAREERFQRERERAAEDISRRKSYMEAAEFKIQEMEEELIRMRQNAAAAALGRVTEQDDRFKALQKEYEDRQEKLERAAASRIDSLQREYDTKVRQMEEMLKAKEELVQQNGQLWTQKQAEYDTLQASMNMKINAFNAEMAARRKALDDRENELNSAQVRNEKEAAARLAEIQTLRVELTRTIAEYKNRK